LQHLEAVEPAEQETMEQLQETLQTQQDLVDLVYQIQSQDRLSLEVAEEAEALTMVGDQAVDLEAEALQELRELMV
jgi:fructose-1-phosphate kinase PfkB-like protein